MNTLRLFLLALGWLFVIAACFSAIGFISSAFEEGAIPDGEYWLALILVEAVLSLLAVALLYLAHRITRRSRLSEQAVPGLEVLVELLCPQCNSAGLVQGPEERGVVLRKSHIARCLECGHRSNVAHEHWRKLSLPNGRDAHETWADKKHLMERSPMTGGQIVFVVFVVFGVIGLLVVTFLLFEVDEGSVSNAILPFAFLAVAYGSWRLGRSLFPSKSIAARRCGKCGYDIRGRNETCCPRCGVPLDSSSVCAD